MQNHLESAFCGPSSSRRKKIGFFTATSKFRSWRKIEFLEKILRVFFKFPWVFEHFLEFFWKFPWVFWNFPWVFQILEGFLALIFFSKCPKKACLYSSAFNGKSKGWWVFQIIQNPVFVRTFARKVQIVQCHQC